MVSAISGIKRVALAAIAVGAIAGPVQAEEVLRVSNWAQYIGENTIANFEKEFGIKVIYDNYESVEAIDSKLLAGNSGYDVVSHSSSAIARLIPAGILQPLDKSKLPNLTNLVPEIMSQLNEKWDPGNQYVIPYMWGTHGVTYNKELVLQTYPDAPIGSMDLLMDPVHMEKLAPCGVSFLDSPTDIIPMTLAHLGLQPDSTDPADYEKAKEALLAIRPYIKTFDNYAYQRMPQKEFCVAFTWGPDGLLAMAGAVEANTGVVLDFYSPPGPGKANLWIDGWIIPADAKNVEAAHKFLNYMMRPDVAAGDSNATWYATANAPARDLVDPAVSGSAASYPPPAAVADMYTINPLPKKIERIRTRVWTDFKAGQ